jgi:hypothetical protein
MFDPLTITVDDLAALGRWDGALTQLGVLHSPIVDAVRGWLIVIQDPTATASGSTRWSSTAPRSSLPPTAHGWRGDARTDAKAGAVGCRHGVWSPHAIRGWR